MDFFADNTVKRLIGEIIKNKGKIPTDKVLWFNMTKNMFHNYPAVDVFNQVYIALEEASDEEWFEHKYPPGFFNEDKVYPKKKKSVIKIDLRQSAIKKIINDNLKISEVAKHYGLKIKNNKILCPFHADSSPSLSISDDKNVFNCFGCHAKGDLITFIRRLENAGYKPKTS